MLIRPALDANSEVPLYRQLAQYFAGLIDSRQLNIGQRLPATRELAGLLGLNRTTVSAAYELLESEGLISGQVGRGSFVTGRAAAPAANGLDWEQILGPSSATKPPSQNGAAISFASSRPSEQLFPLDAFASSCQEVLQSRELGEILQLGSPGGYEPLRQHLLDAARHEGTAGANDDLIVTNGCQQALDLLRRVLVQPGDRVVLEDPVYPGLKNLFVYAGSEFHGVTMSHDGLDLEQLEKTLVRTRPKLLMLTPNFQNPTGATLPLAARQEILRMARASGVVVIENDIYSDLRYEGEALPTLKQLDAAGDGILLRSFSKIAFPGLRVGWVIGPRALIARLMEAKQLSDLHTDQFSQAVLLRFAQSGRLEAHQAEMLRAGSERLRAVLQACERHLPAGTRFSRPQGGMNLWVNLPHPLDAAELLPRAQREGVSYLPGKYFAVSHDHSGGLRLSFAGLAPDLIERGIAILGKLFAAEIEARRWTDRQPAPALV